MSRATRLESALKHDRLMVAGALAAIAAAAWLYMIDEASAMDRTGVCHCAGMVMSAPDTQPWSVAQLVPLFVMWAEMMVAMMLPSAAPMILTFAAVNRRRREQDRPFVPASIFLSGYLAVWCAYSIAAALAQWGLHGTALLSPTMASSSSRLGGVLLIAAGIFQWTPWKHACLSHCQSPLKFLLGGWREGRIGAWRMGLEHGAYCTGCCWLLMALLFVAGVMNMLWVAAITLLVLLEKLAPATWPLRHLVGLIFIVWGGWMILQ
jgi:predicted metal-binding membrane protein